MASKQVTLTEALTAYLNIRYARFAPTTVDNEAFVLRRFILQVGDIQVRHLKAQHVTDWFYGPNGLSRAHVTRDGRHRDAVQPSTHNFYRTRLASFFRYLTTRGWVRQDLLRDTQPMKLPTVKRLQPSPMALLSLLEHAAHDRDRAYIATAINSGLRANEIIRIQVGDLDLAAGAVSVTISKTKEEDYFPVSSDLDSELRRWLIAYGRDLGRPLAADDHLFPARHPVSYRWKRDRDGNAVRGRTPATWVPSRPMTHPERAVQHALRAVGLPTKYQGTHTIRRAVARHFFDSMSNEVGYDAALRTVSAGHASPHVLGHNGALPGAIQRARTSGQALARTTLPHRDGQHEQRRVPRNPQRRRMTHRPNFPP